MLQAAHRLVDPFGRQRTEVDAQLLFARGTGEAASLNHHTRLLQQTLGQFLGTHASRRDGGESLDGALRSGAGDAGYLVQARHDDVAFHLVLGENLWLRSGPCVRFLSDRMGSLLQTDYRGQFSRHHEMMLDALDRHDVPNFRAAMEGDIAATQELLHRFLDDLAA